MGFFSDIKDKIFNRHTASTSAMPDTEPAVHETAPVTPQPAQAAPSAASPTGTAPSSKPTSATPESVASSPAPAHGDVDVAAILDQAVADSGQTLNWRTSIVDLMKTIGIDSSLSSRKALAEELEYKGDKDDSAAMNIWLHKQVLAKLAANGGTVPADLLD